MTIAVLPAHVIDQIAAGEVIERPASVVKELVDNAIDAGARMIQVEITGREMVRVIDDGCGMSPSDLPKAIERHATSKLREIEDLWKLRTMGFRGEALAAIASVSTLTITTRRREDLAATRIVVDGGRVEAFGEVGAPVGTTVEVASLFHTVPARHKFMKAEGTEAGHATDVVSRFAMAHPELHFRLKHNGRVALELPPDRDGLGRARALLGGRIAQRLVAASGEESNVRVTAFLGAPELAQATARSVQLFVGKRAVRDRGLLHAIAMGYGELIPRGRYPIAIVLVEVTGDAVDYNVHPQKLEVRFADGNAVCSAVRHVVQQGITSANWRAEGAGPVVMTGITSVVPPRLPAGGSPSALAQRYAAQLADHRRGIQSRFGFETPQPVNARTWAARERDQVRASRSADADDALFAAATPQVRDRRNDMKDADLAAAALAIETSAPEIVEAPPRFAAGSGAAETPAETARGYFASLKYLGQVDLTYLACEGDGELVLVDQHAAHERVELARLQKSASSRELPVQRMLFPVTIEATPEQLALIGRVAEPLSRVGYEAEAFGKSTIAVKSVPAGIKHGDPSQLLKKLLEEWGTKGAPSHAEIVERMLGEIACHSVVRAGDRLASSEAEALLRNLDELDHDGKNPHGRPLLLRLPLAEIARRFGR